MPEELVSLIIPIFQAEEYLENCVKSLQNQTHTNIEIILINDGSKDASGTIIDRLAQADDRVKVVHKANAGVSAARNSGLDIAKGIYICFVDADDWLSPYFVETFLTVALEYDADFVLSKCVLPAPDNHCPGGIVIEKWSSDEAIENFFYPQIKLGSWNKLYKRSVIFDNDIKFDSRFYMGEGLKFITRISQHSSTIVAFDTPLYYYRQDNPNSVTTRVSLSKLENAIAAIDNIRESLGDVAFSTKISIIYHRWYTAFIALGLFDKGDEISISREFYRDCMFFVKKNSLRLVRHAKISRTRRLLILAAAISPNMTILVYKWVKKIRRV